jgi:hypothetical protein
MKLLQVYDPPMCCPTGVCGPDVDPELPRVAGWLAQMAATGVRVERFNLAQQPLAFVQNPAVKALLDQHDVQALPAVFIDGELVARGGYPTPEQSTAWLHRTGAAPAAS